jgi:hypothetical protein
LERIGINDQSPAYILFSPPEFSKVQNTGNTLSWDNVEQYITMRDGTRKRVPFEIGADVLLKYSRPEKPEMTLEISIK